VKNTILKLNTEMSIVILSGVVMLFSFISGYSSITSLVSFLLVFVKSFVFLIVPLLLYVLEKQNLEFKKVTGFYNSYFIINLFVTIIVSISFVNGVVPIIFKSLFDFVNLIILLSSLFILIEQILNYADVKSKVYSNAIMRIVYLVGNFISYPFLSFINKQIKDKSSDE